MPNRIACLSYIHAGGRTIKLAFAVLASDLNPDYLDFYPLVQSAWKDLMGIEPRLVLIAEEIPAALRPFENTIHLFPPLPGIHTAFQAQCIRLLYPALLAGETDDAVVISDIDLLPVSPQYMKQPIANRSATDFIVYRSNILRRQRQISIMYNAAAPSTWSEIFDGVRDDSDIAETLCRWWSEAGGDYQGIGKGNGWSTDQVKLFEHVQRWETVDGKGRLARLTDRDTGFRRFDRGMPQKFQKRLRRRLSLLRAGHYSDYHMMRPQSEYEALNRRIMDEALTPASRSDRLLAALYRWTGR